MVVNVKACIVAAYFGNVVSGLCQGYVRVVSGSCQGYVREA